MNKTVLCFALMLASCASPGHADEGETTRAASPPPAGRRVAIFAGGCFWCMESELEHIEGVESVVSGYTGGTVDAPTYEQVSNGTTGHAEAIRVVFDPAKVDYERLLRAFFHNIDPVDEGGQFCDRGTQYRSAIFPVDAAQREAARRGIERVTRRLGRPLATRIEPAATFWIAEAHHQDFYRTNSQHYERYRRGCGRDARLREVWGGEAGH